jgi:hypothetical protein
MPDGFAHPQLLPAALPPGTGHTAGETPSPDGEPEPGYRRRFGEGFAFLRGAPLPLTVIVMAGITDLLDAAFVSVLVPVWAR